MLGFAAVGQYGVKAPSLHRRGVRGVTGYRNEWQTQEGFSFGQSYTPPLLLPLPWNQWNFILIFPLPLATGFHPQPHRHVNLSHAVKIIIMKTKTICRTTEAQGVYKIK